MCRVKDDTYINPLIKSGKVAKQVQDKFNSILLSVISKEQRKEKKIGNNCQDLFVYSVDVATFIRNWIVYQKFTYKTI